MPYGISSHDVKSDIYVIISYSHIDSTQLTFPVVYFVFVKYFKLTLQQDITKCNIFLYTL